MNRRGFLGALAGAIAAGSTFDPERALWVPGARRVFIPRPRNVLITPEFYATEALMRWKQVYPELLRLQHDYNVAFNTVAEVVQFSIGETLNVRRPWKFIARS